MSSESERSNFLPERVLPQSDAVVSERDPYLDEAREIITNAEFSKRVNAVLDENGAIGDMRDRLYAEAMDFGPTLDLEQWFDYVAETIDRSPMQTTIDELLRGNDAE